MTSAIDTPASDPEQRDTVQEQRRRLRFRCWHRGTREMDLILGSFADSHIALLGPEELDELDRLLNASDPDVYNWITDREEPPPEMRCGVLDRLKSAGPPSTPGAVTDNLRGA